MSATPIRVAILGAGIWTKEAHLPALQKLGKAVELVAVYSRSKNSAITFAEDAKVSLGASSIDVYADDEAPNVDTLLARTDIDGVLIAVAIPYQPALIKKAWAAGKSVASEKPCASTIEIAEDLIRTYRETYEPKGIRWHVLENFTFESGYLEVRRLAESGIIGKLSFFSYSATFWIATDNRFYNTQWRQNPTHSGGYLIDGGVHHSAALRVSLPSPITQISAFASHHKEILPAPDTIQGIAKLEDGTTGVSIEPFFTCIRLSHCFLP
ncbi:NAD(P)-binding protein [Meredithblackwellia eburnea MCA 4105]